jgi:predicted metal-dependent hydrolase
VNQPDLQRQDTVPVDRWQDAKEFKDCARAWADKIKAQPTRIQVQRMTQKWASCSPGGVVTFSTALLDERKDFGEAVIVHELIHLKVPNHGPVFRSLMKAYLPKSSKSLMDQVACGGFRDEPSAAGDLVR